jgi:hypothetical protein
MMKEGADMKQNAIDDQLALIERMAFIDELKAELAKPIPEPSFSHSYLRKSEWGRYVLKQFGIE